MSTTEEKVLIASLHKGYCGVINSNSMKTWHGELEAEMLSIPKKKRVLN